MGLGSRSAPTWGGSLGVPTVSCDYPPVMAAKVQVQSIPSARGTCTPGEDAGAPLFCPQEAHIIFLQVVLCLTDLQPVPVYCRFRTVHVIMVCCNLPDSEFNSALWARL